MSLAKYESDIHHLAVPAATAYERCADLRHLESIRNRVNDPAALEAASAHVSEEQMADIRKYINDIQFDADSLLLHTQVGDIVLRIVEREQKCIKFASEGAPISIFVWVQLLPETEVASKMKVTVGAEVNMFMKGMVAKPLQQAANGLAQILAAALQAN